MTVGQLKAAIAKYLEKDPSKFVATDFDLLTLALNNAKRHAERLHSFSHLTAYGKILVPVGEEGVAFTAATDTSDVSVRIHKALRFYIRNNGLDVPIRHTSKGVIHSLQDTERPYTLQSYPADFADISYTGNLFRVVLSGRRIFVHPILTEEAELRMDYVGYSPEYTSDADTDYFTEFCADFLMWQGIVEANHFTGSFKVGREGEGLPAPVRLANAALEAIIADDRDDQSNLTPELF